MPWSVVVPIMGVVFAPILAYVVAKRKASGKDTIKGTDAETLFAALGDELKAYRAETSELKGEIKTLNTEIRRLNDLLSLQLMPKPRARVRKAKG